jgi:CheY-like chemotaxis protein
MNAFAHFRDSDFIDQIDILKKAEDTPDPQTFAELLALMETPIGDDAVDMMVRSTLREVLKKNTALVPEGLSSAHPQVFEISLNITAEMHVPEASSALKEIAVDPKHKDHLPVLFRAMAHIKDPEFLEIAKRNSMSDDPVTAASAVSLLGAYGLESITYLKDIFNSISSQCEVMECGGALWSLVENFIDMKIPEGYAFLASQIHHVDPSVRRLLRDGLLRVGEPAVQYLAEMLEKGNDDERLIAADLLGQIGGPSALEALLAALGSDINSNNVSFSIYESLGRLTEPEAKDALLEILAREQDEKLIPVLVDALGRQFAAGDFAFADRLRETVKAMPQKQRGTLFSSSACACNSKLLDAFLSDETLSLEMVECVIASNNAEAAAAFRRYLEGSDAQGREELLSTLDQSAQDLKAVPTRGKILAVDDSAAMRLMYTGIMQELNIGLETAANGLEALQNLSNGEVFDAVIVDMNMPEMDGVEMTKRLRTMPGFSDIPVIMITTETGIEQGKSARMAGVDSFLVKPFMPEALKRKLLKIVPEAEPSA